MLTAKETELLKRSTTLQAVHKLFGNYAFEIWLSSALKVGFSEERILNEANDVLDRQIKQAEQDALNAWDEWSKAIIRAKHGTVNNLNELKSKKERCDQRLEELRRMK